MHSQLNNALAYYQSGYIIIPIREKTEGTEQVKKPYVYFEDFKSGKDKPTEKDIRTRWTKWPNAMIGIITGSVNKLTVLDFDIYHSENGDLDKLVEAFPGFPDDINTPTAITPKGGYHYYFKYNSKIPHKARITSIIDGRNDGGYIIAPPSISEAGKYEWQNGKRPSNLPFLEIPEQWVTILINNNNIYIDNHKNLTTKTTITTSNHRYFEEGTRDDDLFTVANALTKVHLEPAFIKQTLELIAKNLGNEFNEKVIDAKIISAMNRIDRTERSISDEVRQWVLAQPGNFKLQDCHNELQLTTTNHKKACNMAILRLTEGDKPLLKKYGKARGVYTRIEDEVEEIKLNRNALNGIKFEWMMGFSQYIKTMPKTIYVIAGEPDSGKSALCLNLAIKNCGVMPVSYFSSEMGSDELGERIGLMDDVNFDYVEKNIKFYERDGNFEDAIKPDHINFIDYYEISKDFWEIAESLKNIRSSLNKGIAIVAVQKKRGMTLGRGAEFGLEKPRLYMRVEPYREKNGIKDGNIIIIEKAKNWRDPKINPNGLTMRFKLVKGINLIPSQSDWYPEIDQKYTGLIK